MSKEEQEAIDYLKEDIDLYEDGYYLTTDDHMKAVEILVNYISKLQEENELMKKELNKCSEHILPCMFETSKDYVSKDKIRDIVEKSYNDIDYYKRDIMVDLEELLEE